MPTTLACWRVPSGLPYTVHSGGLPRLSLRLCCAAAFGLPLSLHRHLPFLFGFGDLIGLLEMPIRSCIIEAMRMLGSAGRFFLAGFFTVPKPSVPCQKFKTLIQSSPLPNFDMTPTKCLKKNQIYGVPATYKTLASATSHKGRLPNLCADGGNGEALWFAQSFVDVGSDCPASSSSRFSPIDARAGS